MTKLIEETLVLVRDRLDESLTNARARARSWVLLSDVLGDGHQAYDEARDAVVMSLLNITPHPARGAHHLVRPVRDGGGHVVVAPPLDVSLTVSFRANFRGASYRDGLWAISEVIAFFQQHPSFDQHGLPGLSPAIERLSFDPLALDLAQLRELTALVGTSYCPTVVYQVGMLRFDGRAVQAEVAGVPSRWRYFVLSHRPLDEYEAVRIEVAPRGGDAPAVAFGKGEPVEVGDGQPAICLTSDQPISSPPPPDLALSLRARRRDSGEDVVLVAHLPTPGPFQLIRAPDPVGDVSDVYVYIS